MIFRKAKNGAFKSDSGLQQLYDTVNVFEIDVAECGVKGASKFFEAQVDVLKINFIFIIY